VLATTTSKGLKIAENGKAKRSKKKFPVQLTIEYARKSRKYKLQSVLHLSPENDGNVLILTADVASVADGLWLKIDK
jgi:hypothetical protein